MSWFLYCLRNYATFTGRASRPEYWWFYLFTVVISLALRLLVLPFGGPVAAQIIGGLWSLAVVVPNISVASRRLHDSGHSLWWYGAWAAGAVPVGWLLGVYTARGQQLPDAPGLGLYILVLAAYSVFVLYLLCKPGDLGRNRYGDPAPTSPT
jgi:uncharacterized membrane protein YhaH (DUF805 family)